MNNQGPSWPLAIVALGFLAFVAVLFLIPYYRDGIDVALEVWSAIGTVVGVLIGAVPAYYFGKVARDAQKNAQALRMAADDATIEKAKRYGLRA